MYNVLRIEPSERLTSQEEADSESVRCWWGDQDGRTGELEEIWGEGQLFTTSQPLIEQSLRM